MLKLGIILTAATVTILVVEFFRARRRPFPAHGWLGLVALICAEYLMFHGIEPAATYFSPVAWTSYILIADAAIFAISGHSRLREEPRGLLKMAALSIPLWLIFEAYNLRLANWAYVGLPQGHIERWIGYGWAFATITPGIFMTAALIESFGWFNEESRPLRFSRATETAFIVLGAAMLIVPLLVPTRAAAYLFGLVWLGFYSFSSRSTTASTCLLSWEISRGGVAPVCTHFSPRAGCAAGCGNSGITGLAPVGFTHFRSASNGRFSRCPRRAIWLSRCMR